MGGGEGPHNPPRGEGGRAEEHQEDQRVSPPCARRPLATRIHARDFR